MSFFNAGVPFVRCVIFILFLFTSPCSAPPTSPCRTPQITLLEAPASTGVDVLKLGFADSIVYGTIRDLDMQETYPIYRGIVILTYHKSSFDIFICVPCVICFTTQNMFIHSRDSYRCISSNYVFYVIHNFVREKTISHS